MRAERTGIMPYPEKHAPRGALEAFLRLKEVDLTASPADQAAVLFPSCPFPTTVGSVKQVIRNLAGRARERGGKLPPPTELVAAAMEAIRGKLDTGRAPPVSSVLVSGEVPPRVAPAPAATNPSAGVIAQQVVDLLQPILQQLMQIRGQPVSPTGLATATELLTKVRSSSDATLRPDIMGTIGCLLERTQSSSRSYVEVSEQIVGGLLDIIHQLKREKAELQGLRERLRSPASASPSAARIASRS